MPMRLGTVRRAALASRARRPRRHSSPAARRPPCARPLPCTHPPHAAGHAQQHAGHRHAPRHGHAGPVTAPASAVRCAPARARGNAHACVPTAVVTCGGWRVNSLCRHGGAAPRHRHDDATGRRACRAPHDLRAGCAPGPALSPRVWRRHTGPLAVNSGRLSRAQLPYICTRDGGASGRRRVRRTSILTFALPHVVVGGGCGGRRGLLVLDLDARHDLRPAGQGRGARSVAPLSPARPPHCADRRARAAADPSTPCGEPLR